MTSQPGPRSAAREWRDGWPVVMAGLFGFILLSMGSLSMGVFMAPMERAFDWTRSEYSVGLTGYAIVGVIFSPLAGLLVDKWGVRVVAVCGSVFTGIAFGLFATSTGSVSYWFALWLVLGMANQLLMLTVWSTAVAGAFTVQRGLALSIVTVGSAVGALIAPVAANILIAQYGWRIAYAGMGAVGGGAVALICWYALGFRGGPADPNNDSGLRQSTPLTGLSFSEGLRSAPFAKLAIVAFISYGLLMALSLHLIQIFSGIGVDRNLAVVIAGSYGLPMLLGKLIGGIALDRFSGRAVAAAGLALLGASYAVLILPFQPAVGAILAIALFGFAFGGISPVLPYLASRFFGLRSFGKLFGILNGIYSLATATCPLLAGWVYDVTGSYFLFLVGALPAAILAIGLILSLGRYPDFEAAATRR